MKKKTGYLCFVFLTPRSHLFLTLNVVVYSVVLMVSFCDIMESLGCLFTTIHRPTVWLCQCVLAFGSFFWRFDL